MKWLLTKQYPMVKKVVLVMDNLSFILDASLYATFLRVRRDLAERLRNHYTPKHGVGLILRRLSYPLLVASALQTTEFLIFLRFGVSSNRGLLQETLLRKA